MRFPPYVRERSALPFSGDMALGRAPRVKRDDLSSVRGPGGSPSPGVVVGRDVPSIGVHEEEVEAPAPIRAEGDASAVRGECRLHVGSAVLQEREQVQRARGPHLVDAEASTAIRGQQQVTHHEYVRRCALAPGRRGSDDGSAWTEGAITQLPGQGNSAVELPGLR